MKALQAADVVCWAVRRRAAHELFTGGFEPLLGILDSGNHLEQPYEEHWMQEISDTLRPSPSIMGKGQFRCENGVMPAENPLEVFRRFVAAINTHDVEALAALMSAEHLFVDSMGNRMSGVEAMRKAWAGYFDLCRDYWISVETVVAEGGTVLACGEAGGVIDGSVWRTLAAWKAVVRDGAVAEWRVFADNKPVYEIMARRAR